MGIRRIAHSYRSNTGTARLGEPRSDLRKRGARPAFRTVLTVAAIVVMILLIVAAGLWLATNFQD
jgi:hypothetical protein